MRSSSQLGVVLGAILVVLTSVRAASAETQQGLADALVVQLIHAEGKDFDRIVRALRPLGEPAVQAVGQGLDSRDAGVRLACVRAAARLGRAAEPLGPRIAKALEDAQPDVRLAAIDALNRIGAPPSRAAADGLVGLLTRSDPSQRSAARGALLRMGAEAVPPLTRLAQSDAPDVRVLALQTLVDLQPFQDRAIAVLTRALGDEEPTVVDAAIALLGRIGPAAEKATPRLLRFLTDETPTPRVLAVQTALGRIGAPAGIARLRNALGDKRPAIRQNAATALGFAGPAAAVAVADLVKALDDEFAEVRAAAAFALGCVGPAAARRVEKPLLAAADDPDGAVRARVAAAIGQMRLRTGVATLRTRLKDEEPSVRSAAVLALGQLGDAAREAAPDLAKAIAQKSSPVRLAAAAVVPRLGPAATKALPALRDLLDELASDPPVAAHVRGSIVAIDPTASREQASLAVQIASGEPAERRAALRVVAELPTAANALGPVLTSSFPRNDAPAAIWWRVARIRMLDPAHRRQNAKEAKRLLDEIATALSHSNPDVRLAAVAALDALGPLAKPVERTIAESVRFEPETAPGAYLRLLQKLD